MLCLHKKPFRPIKQEPVDRPLVKQEEEEQAPQAARKLVGVAQPQAEDRPQPGKKKARTSSASVASGSAPACAVATGSAAPASAVDTWASGSGFWDTLGRQASPGTPGPAASQVASQVAPAASQAAPASAVGDTEAGELIQRSSNKFQFRTAKKRNPQKYLCSYFIF